MITTKQEIQFVEKGRAELVEASAAPIKANEVLVKTEYTDIRLCTESWG